MTSQKVIQSTGEDSFQLTEFLEGATSAWGIFEDRFGRVQNRIFVTMVGRWSGDEFLLEEDFLFEDGHRDSRTWRVRNSVGGFTATCDECVGEAKGKTTGNTIAMAYKFRLKTRGREILVDFEDRLIRVDAFHAVNRATIRKWGVKLGELSLFFTRDREPPSDREIRDSKNTATTLDAAAPQMCG